MVGMLFMWYTLWLVCCLVGMFCGLLGTAARYYYCDVCVGCCMVGMFVWLLDGWYAVRYSLFVVWLL